MSLRLRKRISMSRTSFADAFKTDYNHEASMVAMTTFKLPAPAIKCFYCDGDTKLIVGGMRGNQFGVIDLVSNEATVHALETHASTVGYLRDMIPSICGTHLVTVCDHAKPESYSVSAILSGMRQPFEHSTTPSFYSTNEDDFDYVRLGASFANDMYYALRYAHRPIVLKCCPPEVVDELNVNFECLLRVDDNHVVVSRNTDNGSLLELLICADCGTLTSTGIECYVPYPIGCLANFGHRSFIAVGGWRHTYISRFDSISLKEIVSTMFKSTGASVCDMYAESCGIPDFAFPQSIAAVRNLAYIPTLHGSCIVVDQRLSQIDSVSISSFSAVSCSSSSNQQAVAVCCTDGTVAHINI